MSVWNLCQPFVLLGFSQRLFLPDVSEWRGGITTFSPSRRNSGGHEGMLLIRTDSVQLGKEKENVFKWRCLYTELFIYLKTIWMLGWFSLVSVSSCDVTVFGVCVFFFLHLFKLWILVVKFARLRMNLNLFPGEKNKDYQWEHLHIWKVMSVAVLL